MRPKPPRFMSGNAARTRMTGARPKIAMKPSQICGVNSSMPGARASASGRTLDMPMPALLMTASMAPNLARAAATALWQTASVPRSATMGCSRSFAVPSWAVSLSSAAGSRSTAATECPAARSTFVITRPIPPAAPVNSTTRPDGEAITLTFGVGILAHRLFRRLRYRVLAKFPHHFLGEEPHRIALPRFVRSAPVEPGHQQRAERADFLAEGDELVEHGLRRAVEHAAFGDDFDSGFFVRHVRIGL